MKTKVIGWIVLLSYPCSMYGLKGVEEWIGWLAILLPFASILLWPVLSFIVDVLFGKDKIDTTTMLYISFVFSVFGVMSLNLNIDFAIGRMAMLIGGTLLYLDRHIYEKEKDNRTIHSSES